MSNFVGLNTALSGLRAAQFGLDTASNNVANASTEGYTRQRVGLKPSLSFPSAVGPLGTGVTITGIDRLRDTFLDARMRTGLGQSTYHGTRAVLLNRTEAVMAEPENGITSALNGLWDSFEDWALAPGQVGPQRQVVASLDGLASRIQSVSTGWEQLETDTSEQIVTLTGEANRLLGQVAELNRSIPIQTTLGGPPNDLLDQRDVLADRLAELIGATASTDDAGVMTISVKGRPILDGVKAPELQRAGAGFTVAGGPAHGEQLIAGGELGAMVDFVVDKMPAQRAQLDDFVTALVEQLHTHHGPDADPPALELLVGADGNPVTARNIAVNPELSADPSRLTAGKGGEHDASTAEALAGLRTESAVAGDPTLNNRFNAQIVGLASQVSTAGRAAKSEHDLVTAATVARQSGHGVSIDEEMAAVVQHSRSLEAMSRVMTAIDEALNVLINRTGIVGR